VLLCRTCRPYFLQELKLVKMRTDSDLGTIEFVRSARAKNINVRILKDSLRVSLPARATEEEAMRFINSVREKIIRKQNKLKNNVQRNKLILNENSELQTLTFLVKIKPAERNNIFLSLQNNILTIELPEKTDYTNNAIQAQLWNGINYFLKKEAKRILPERTIFLGNKHFFSFSSVKIQSSKSRWGSCSQGRNINLSFYLMLLPQHLVDYVILHELCHTKEMNHSSKFWLLMDKVTDGQSKELRAEMKNYNMPTS